MSEDAKQPVSTQSSPQADLDRRLHLGTVYDVNPYQQSCVVQLLGKASTLCTCYWLQQGLANLLGMRITTAPSVGATVLVFWEPGMTEGLILGRRPSVQFEGATVPYMNYVGFEQGKTYKTAAHQKVDLEQKNILLPMANTADLHPADNFNGDHVLLNDYGCALSILKVLVSLKASDLAQIRLYAMDDLVQLITHNFHHFTSFGDFRILNDEGELTVSWEGSHRENEAQGSADPSAAPFVNTTATDDELNASVQPSGSRDKSDAIGLWRFKLMLGYLGDFFNMFLLQPKDTLGKLSSAAPDNGLFQFHVGTDGGCVLRSVQEVALEKCGRIAVPKKLKEAEDPTGDSLSGDYDPSKVVKEPFYWSDNTHPFIKILQLRDYVAYMNVVYNPARVRAHTKDWKIPEEGAVPGPESGSQEYDTNANARYESVFATIRILFDGSILLLDSTGNSITMSKGSIKMSATDDIWLEAGRNINMLAGNDLILKARKSADLTTTEGDIRVAANKNAMLTSAAGGVLVEALTDAVPASSEQQGGETMLIRGVLVRAEKSVVTLFGGSVSLAATTFIYLKSKIIRLVADTISNICNASWLARVKNGALSLFPNSMSAYVDSISAKGSLTVYGGASKKQGGKEWGVITGNQSLQDTTGSEAKAAADQEPIATDTGASSVTFTFRSDDEYRMPSDFEMYRTSAQQDMLRHNASEVWTERSVTTKGKKTWPFPGGAVLTGEKLVTYTEQSVNSNNLAKDFATVNTVDPEDGVKMQVMNQNYVVRKVES